MTFLPPRCPDCRTPMVFIAVDMTSQGGPPEGTWLCKNQKCGRALESYEPQDGESICAPPEEPDPLTTSALVDVLARLILNNRLTEANREDTLGVLMKSGAFLTFRPPKGPPYGVVFRGSHGDPNDPLVRLSTLIDARIEALKGVVR